MPDGSMTYSHVIEAEHSVFPLRTTIHELLGDAFNGSEDERNALHADWAEKNWVVLKNYATRPTISDVFPFQFNTLATGEYISASEIADDYSIGDGVVFPTQAAAEAHVCKLMSFVERELKNRRAITGTHFADERTGHQADTSEVNPLFGGHNNLVLYSHGDDIGIFEFCFMEDDAILKHRSTKPSRAYPPGTRVFAVEFLAEH